MLSLIVITRHGHKFEVETIPTTGGFVFTEIPWERSDRPALVLNESTMEVYYAGDENGKPLTHQEYQRLAKTHHYRLNDDKFAVIFPGVDVPKPKSVLVVSWNERLAIARASLLTSAGYTVTSALGRSEATLRCRTSADLLVLGHSVPRSEKQEIISFYRQRSMGPVLSLLRPSQQKLLDADFGAEAQDPTVVVEVVRKILNDWD